MLRNQEICNFLNDNLSGEHKFKIFSEIGRSKDDGAIHGVLTRNNPQMTPLSDVIVNDYNFTIELSIPAQLGNKYLESVEKTINDFAKEWNGKEYAFEDGKGTLHFNLTGTGSFNTSSRVGNQVPLVFGLTVVYTEDVVTSLNKHWLLDGVEIPFISEDVMLEKEGITKPIQGKKYKETLLTGQTKFYHFRMYFKEGLATNLHQDILEGDFEKTYKLEYYDGVSFTQENPFETTVSIFRSANANSEKPRASILDIIFSDVEEFKDGTIYEFGLFDDDFDVQSENTRYFNSQEEQRDYYNEKVKNGAEFQRIKTPNLDSIVITNQVYRNINNYDLFNLTNKNKAVIRVGTKTGNDIEYHKYFYYDVLNPVIGAKNQVTYDLKIDSVQTCLFNPDIEFEGSFIEKAHLNRWIDNGDGTISFNGKADSKLFEREEIKEVAKRLVQREKLQYHVQGNYIRQTTKPSYQLVKNDGDEKYYYKENNEYKLAYKLTETEYENVDIYLNKEKGFTYNINQAVAWVYIFIDDGQYNIRSQEGTDVKTTINRANVEITQDVINESMPLPTAILCFPIGYRLPVQNKQGGYFYISIEGWQQFCLKNPLATTSSFMKSIKLSVKPPFELFSISAYDYGFRYDTTFVLNASVNESDVIPLRKDYLNVFQTGLSGDAYGLLNILTDYGSATPFRAKNKLCELTFNKSDIINKEQNILFNPKLNSDDYKDLVLTIAGSQYNMPLNKINKENPEFRYFEALTPDITKGLLRLSTIYDDSVFGGEYGHSFNGFAYSNDFNIAFAQEQYSQYIANNKNAYLSFQNQQKLAMAQFSLRTAQNTLDIATNPLNILNETKEIGFDALNTGLNIAYNQAQFNLSIDNMKSAPDTMQNTNGSAVLSSMIDEFGLYVEIYKGLDHELEIANDIMARDGYIYNQFDNIKIYNKIRKYFNYIKANIGTITGVAISNPIRADIRNRFANGIRFWKPINGEYKVDYSKENYEEWIDTNLTSFEEWLAEQ